MCGERARIHNSALGLVVAPGSLRRPEFASFHHHGIHKRKNRILGSIDIVVGNESKGGQGDIKLGADMDVQDALIKRHVLRCQLLHRLPQCKRRTGVIQRTRLVRYIFIKQSRDLVCLRIGDRPHRPDHRTESSKLHRGRKMNHFVRTFFVPDCSMTRGEVRKFRILEVAPNKAMDREVSVRESERGLERPFLLRETMTSKVRPLVLTQLFSDPGNACLFPLDACERRKTSDALADIRQFGTDRKKLVLVGGLCLANGNELLHSPFSRKPSTEPFHPGPGIR